MMQSGKGRYRNTAGADDSPQLHTEITSVQFDPRLLPIAEAVCANLIGFSPASNPFFRLKKWTFWSIVRGWMFLIRKVEGREIRICPQQDEVWHTLDHLRADGVVAVNRFPHAHGKQMQANQGGGHGSPAERLPSRERECREMLREFPEMIAVKSKRYGKVTVPEPYLRPQRKHQGA